VNDSTWTWISGSDHGDQPGVYDGSDVTPSSRAGAVSWYDSASQEFWLFGGFGLANDGST